MAQHTHRKKGSRGGRSGALKSQRRGSSLVEFALILPVLLALLIGIMEFGWFTKNTLLLANATREGARSASLGASTTDIQARITNSARPLIVSTSDIVMSSSANNGTTYTAWPADNATTSKNGVTTGHLIRIASSAFHRPLTGFFPFLNNRRLQTFVTMRRET